MRVRQPRMGFPSSGSDYDVRFIYVRPVGWYLSIFDRRDVIERPIDGLPGITGWDLRKALQLLRKSSPPLLEWLGSPMVYWEKYSIAKRAGEELDRGQRIATIGNFIARELKRLGGKEIHHDRRLLPDEQPDKLFRGSIKEVWLDSIPIRLQFNL